VSVRDGLIVGDTGRRPPPEASGGFRAIGVRGVPGKHDAPPGQHSEVPAGEADDK
jgi:hypothetical protein